MVPPGGRTLTAGADELAVGDFSRAMQLGAKGWGVWAERGYASLQKQDLAAAVADYTEVIRLNPDASADINRGVALDRRGELDKAILDFNEAIRMSLWLRLRSPIGARPTGRSGISPGPSTTAPKPSA